LGQKCAIQWGGPGKIAGKSPARQALPLVKAGTSSAVVFPYDHVEMRRLRRKIQRSPWSETFQHSKMVMKMETQTLLWGGLHPEEALGRLRRPEF